MAAARVEKHEVHAHHSVPIVPCRAAPRRFKKQND
jgi:hypothetical protein